MDWRIKVQNVSEKVFPGLSHNNLKYYGYEVQSSVFLQMFLFFNVIFFPIWFIITTIFLYNQYEFLDEMHRFILLTVFLATTLTEMVRLYLGYEGNLRDKIPELAGFWLLSILLQFPLQTVIACNPYFNWNILEIVSHVIMDVMLIIQIIIGYCTLKKTANHQATIYRIMKLGDISTVE